MNIDLDTLGFKRLHDVVDRCILAFASRGALMLNDRFGLPTEPFRLNLLVYREGQVTYGRCRLQPAGCSGGESE